MTVIEIMLSFCEIDCTIGKTLSHYYYVLSS